jgi:hypothetical protein
MIIVERQASIILGIPMTRTTSQTIHHVVRQDGNRLGLSGELILLQEKTK